VFAEEEITPRFSSSTIPIKVRALEMGRYTGQRLSDVIRLAWSDYGGQRIGLRQWKTGTP
jgi:integrase